ncbi:MULTISPECIES: molybdopterin-dependent oxidoreductase [Rhizobium]|uniref:Molybdopterin-dependent oxidoreductase n=1 Tax=Rhizobium indicum TaxID=2583231 RepID=A0ABX6PQW7_9HYPH|nr:MULTISPECIES: molybdopterin-dependent oxidoreductase [Rhizobium]NEI63898.1 molybdopterin-dependent oxidoreductase [Rhizobium leguminosarum]NKL19271.1 molybdopterin-dependent oxidoreductase [Rhizobium leguminosarum bv. viciae]NKL38260.1 molybdopterin-dependent oxidoreductase [Rhizobium leguminosarum bv. viciae]NKL57699.1 molybdopterin-dependent oxidoreductase [Rhizobium leguminosarum bv. viciae]QIJ45406.1 molybdopterin-dependent oxidoreductase [Rhizobium leguminosarum]
MTRTGMHMIRKGFSFKGPANGIHALNSWITPEEDLFLVTHMGFLNIDPDHWHLDVDGLVGTPTRLRLSDLQAMPQREYMSFHECAGSPLAPTVAKRRIGNVVWKGVPLSLVLERAKISTDTSYVWTSGLEWGEYAEIEETYQKELPIEKALAEEVLLALEINGRPLTPERGGPVRLVVPGWYGTNSVKWVGSITAADRRASGAYTTRFYNDPTASGTKPVWDVAPESVIVSPSPNDLLSADMPTKIWGWAWGDRRISSVEVSVDGGGSWQTASLGPREGRSWQRFELTWSPEPGPHVLLCRCKNELGEEQPASDARNAVHSVQVQVDF